QPTATRRRDLHLPVDARGRAYDALRLRELVAQRLGAAAPNRRWIAFGIRRACRSLTGRRVRRLRERHIGARNDEKGGDERDCDAQGLLLSLHMPLVNVERPPSVPAKDQAPRRDCKTPPARLGTGREYLQLRSNEQTCSVGNVCLSETPSFRAPHKER